MDWLLMTWMVSSRQYRIIGAPKNFKKCPHPLFRPKTNLTCHQKPNPSRETVPLKAGIFVADQDNLTSPSLKIQWSNLISTVMVHINPLLKKYGSWLAEMSVYRFTHLRTGIQCCGSGSRSAFPIRIQIQNQEGVNDLQKLKKVKIF
jgi:hypothetical protein